MAQAAAGFATPGHEQGVPAWAAAAAAAVRQAVIMPVARQRFNIYLCLTRVRVLLHPFCSPTVGLQQMQLVNSWARLAAAHSPWKRKSGTPPLGDPSVRLVLAGCVVATKRGVGPWQLLALPICKAQRSCRP